MSTRPFYPNQDLIAAAQLIAAADDTALTSGTVTFHLYALTGDNEGKWWDADEEEWSDTEATAGDGTHVAQGLWTTTIDEAALNYYTRYSLYIKEATSLAKPWSVELVPMATAYDGTLETVAAPGVIDICNMAIGILTGAVNATYPFLDTWDMESASQESLVTLRWMHILYPRARNKVQSLWDGPPCLRYATMGAALAEASALTVPGYDYVYSQPNGCLSFRGIVANDVNANTGRISRIPFLKAGKQIACNIDNDDDDPQYLFEYNALVQNPTDWTEGLINATAHMLALYSARSLGGSLENQAMLKQLFDVVWAEARSERQSEIFTVDHRAQTGGAVELGPGVIDWKFPLPE